MLIIDGSGIIIIVYGVMLILVFVVMELCKEMNLII